VMKVAHPAGPAILVGVVTVVVGGGVVVFVVVAGVDTPDVTHGE
jgi:hypothetical protein